MPRYNKSKEEREKESKKFKILSQLIKLSDKPLTSVESISDYLLGIFKNTLETAIKAEADAFMGYDKNSSKQREENNISNYRNGYGKKTVKSSAGSFELKTPRDRNSEFDSGIVPKTVTDISHFDEKFIALYAQGNSLTEVQRLIKSLFKLDISTSTISAITNKLMPLIWEEQNRPLDGHYPIVFCDGKVVKVRENNEVVKKTVYTILAFTNDGKKEILGFYIGKNESSEYWLEIFNDLKRRGVKSIWLFCTDNLKGFSQSIKAVFTDSDIQKCIIHQIRNATKYVIKKDLREVCDDMRKIYTAPNETEAFEAFTVFDNKWSEKYPSAVKSWKNNWDELTTFLKFSSRLRKMLYTTNIIENFNRKLSSLVKKRVIYNGVNSVMKDVYFTIISLKEQWKNTCPNWNLIIKELKDIYGK